MPAPTPRCGVAWLGLVTAILAGCAEAAPVTLPGGIPPIDCRGVPAEICQQAVNDARANAKPGEFLVQVRVVCRGAQLHPGERRGAGRRPLHERPP